MSRGLLGVVALGAVGFGLGFPFGCGLQGETGNGGFGNSGGPPAGSSTSTGDHGGHNPVGVGPGGSGGAGGMGGMGGSPPVENCTNGIDDDGNGKIDCADPACDMDPTCQFDWFVDITNTNMNPPPDGTRAHPFPDITTTVAMCDGMTARKIFVAAGSYPPVSLPANCSLTGAGRDVTLFDGMVNTGANMAPIVILQAGTTPGITLDDLGVKNGTSPANGGGIYADNGNLTVEHVTVQTCHASSQGGGFYATDLTLTLTDVELANNTSSGDGAGAYITNCAAVTLTDVAIDGNTSSGNAGGLSIGLGQTTSIATLTRLIATLNHAASYAGGIYFYGGTFSVERSRIQGNAAANAGGVASVATVLKIYDTLIADNSATTDGDGLTLSGAADQLEQVTIAGNTGNGQAVRCNNMSLVGENLIVWGNQGTNVAMGCNFDAQFTDSQDGGPISADPLFVAAAMGNYHLMPNSPARNKGSTAFTTMHDLDDNPRTDGKPDLGCYEVQGN